MRFNVRTTFWLAALALLGGCSTAPFCDIMDRACPTRNNTKRKEPYGGVCLQGQNSPYLQPDGPPGVPGPIVVVGPPSTPPPPGPLIPPPTPSPFVPQQQIPPIVVPPPPPR